MSDIPDHSQLEFFGPQQQQFCFLFGKIHCSLLEVDEEASQVRHIVFLLCMYICTIWSSEVTRRAMACPRTMVVHLQRD